MTTLATAPDGKDYEVSVEWLPHGRRIFRRLRDNGGDSNFDGNGLDFPDLGGDDIFVAIAIGIAVFVLIILFWWLILPALFVVLDFLLIALLVAAGVVLKVVFRRPWTIAVRVDGYDDIVAKGGVVGWNAAGRAREAIADAIRAGSEPASAVRQAGLVTV